MSYMMKVLTDLGVDFTKKEHTHYKFQSKGFMDLTVETWKVDEWLHVTVAHYYVQEGDLMSDPEIEFRARNFIDPNGPNSMRGLLKTFKTFGLYGVFFYKI